MRIIQPAGAGITSSENVSFIRSEDRERREAQERTQKPTPQTHPWIVEAKQEHDRLQAIRAAKIASGKITIHLGVETEHNWKMGE
jgi:hypothetical protein